MSSKSNLVCCFFCKNISYIKNLAQMLLLRLQLSYYMSIQP